MTSDADEVLSSLHHLVKNLEPIIKSSESAEVAEDAILHLEETDENFHKHEFVKYVRDQLESSMGPLIDEEIERNSMGNGLNSTSGQETLVHLVKKSVSESKIFSDIVHKLCNETLRASDSILQNIEEERLSAIGEDDVHSLHSRRYRSHYSEGASTCGSSFNQNMFFLSQEEFHSIADELDVHKPLTVRRDALKRLCHVPPSDVMASESWSQLRISLMDALADSDSHIAHDALGFHARMFAVSNNQIMRETYTCLAEHCKSLFESDKREHLPYIVDGLDISQPEMVQILKRIRLLNEFQRQVPAIWVRYPEYFLETIVESTLSIVVLKPKSVQSQTKELVSPVHLVSLFDAKANWLRKWLHGNYSRCIVIKQLHSQFRSFLVDAVECCLNFCEKCRQRSSGVHRVASKVKQHKPSEENRRIMYSPAELEHLAFIHSLCVAGHLLLYSGGRKLFPIDAKAQKNVTVQNVLISWIQILSLVKHKPKCGHKLYEPASVVGKMLRTLCTSSAFVESCVTSDVIDALLEPVKSWLHPGVGESDHIASEATMLQVSEVLACLTSTPPGRRKLMYGCSDIPAASSKRKVSAAAHTIAEFAHRALSGNLPHSGSRSPSYLVVGSFVFVCRQIYNTCDGLVLLKEYRLHESISRTWKQAHDRRGETSTPTNSDEDGAVETLPNISPSQSSSHNMLLWEENLIDNLLNYAATPKGLLLLQQTGAMNECVSYMFSRYTKKLQVSKCEKFGYGVMVTQVAATAPGIAALQLAGFEKALVHELWSNLECGSDDIRMTAPLPHPLSPVDRSIQKFFIGLVNLLSSYAATYYIFHRQDLPNKPMYGFREMPDSILSLFDRVIMVNSEAKVHSLFNYESSNLFGLRLLNVLCCCLDTWLLLDTQFNVQKFLLDMQKDDCTYEGNIIIDALSVQRNHILVRTQAIGGPSERRLPPSFLESASSRSKKSSKQNFYPWPLFNHFPLPKEYTPSVPSKSSLKKESVVTRFLSKTKSTDKNRAWLEQCRSVYAKTMSTTPSSLRGNILTEMLEKAISAQERMPEERIFPNSFTSDDLSETLSDVSNAGMKLVARYGKHLKLLKSNTDTTISNLSYVLKSCQSFLRAQQQLVPKQSEDMSQMKMLHGPYYGFDWFASTIFLMMSGNKDRTSALLQKLADLLCSGFLWPARLHASVHIPHEMRLSCISPIFFCTGHRIELILQNELPLVHSTFRMCGYTPSQICQHWLKQCFWNCMDWVQITHYVSLVVVMGTDYQVYICVSIMKHLQEKILKHRLTQDLQVFLKEQPLDNFVVASYMDYMQSLESKYRGTVLSDMRSVVGK